MFRSLKVVPPALAAVAGLTLALNEAQAVDYTGILTNPSFEAQGGPPYIQNAQNQPYDTVTGWRFEGAGTDAMGTNDRDTATYPNSVVGPSNHVLGFFNMGATGVVNDAITNVPIGYTVGYIATVTVAFGNPAGLGGANTYQTPGMYRIEFVTQQQNTVMGSSPWIDPTPGTGTNGGIPDGSLKDYSFSYQVPANFVADPNNNAVRIRIESMATTDGQQSSFDDVRLDVSQAPEPVSASLIGLGGLLMLRRRR